MISKARAATLRTMVTELLELREPSRDFDGGVALALRTHLTPTDDLEIPDAPEFTESIGAVMVAIRDKLPPTFRPALVQQPDESWRAALLTTGIDTTPCPHLRGWLPGATLAACLLLTIWLRESSHEGTDPSLRPDLSTLVG